MRDGRFALAQPLVTRPAYGTREQTIAESGLPTGDPGGKGLTLDKDIPGQSTFNKPEDDTREFDKADEGSIYRKDGPDDVAKPQKDRKQDERHHENFQPRFIPPGGRPKDDPTVTKYPYRDDRKHHHYAAVSVAERYLLRHAHELVLTCEEHSFRVATKLDAVEEGLNPFVTERAQTCSVAVKRADIPNLRWLFSVDCGNGPKIVKIKAARAGRAVRMSKLELHLACSCPAWRWLGPEHHSKREDYIDGKPRGTASVPVIRDPEGINRVCKHVAAVLNKVRGWQVPKKG